MWARDDGLSVPRASNAAICRLTTSGRSTSMWCPVLSTDWNCAAEDRDTQWSWPAVHSSLTRSLLARGQTPRVLGGGVDDHREITQRGDFGDLGEGGWGIEMFGVVGRVGQ